MTSSAMTAAVPARKRGRPKKTEGGEKAESKQIFFWYSDSGSDPISIV